VISCVIPSRDRAGFLPRAIDSVTCQDASGGIEIVLVDDGSVDGTADLVARRYPGVRLLRTVGVGAAAARNTGVEAAAGEIIMFLDSDDRWLPGHVSALVAALAEKGAACGVTRNVDEINGEEFLVPLPSAGEEVVSYAALSRWCNIMTSALAVRRDFFVSCGGFPEEMGSLGEDWAFFIRLAARGGMGWAGPEAVSERFLHPGSSCALVSRDRLWRMFGDLSVVVGRERYQDKGGSVGPAFAEIIKWLERIEENRCLSVQQWYLLMKRAGLVPP